MKEHRKRTLTTKKYTKLGKNQNLIKVRDFYPNNCTGSEYTIVDDNTLSALLGFIDEDIRYCEWDGDHRAGEMHVDNEGYSASLGAMEENYVGDVETILFIEQVLEKYGDEYIDCAKYRFIHGLSISAVAEMVGISYNKAYRIIYRAGRFLYFAVKNLE